MDENKLILDNMGLVKSIARKCRPYNRTEYEEYVQVGTIGLLKAIRAHKPEMGKLTTIAWTAIIWEISRYKRKNKYVKTEELPTNLEQEISINIDDYLPNLNESEKVIVSMRLQGYKIEEIQKLTNETKYKIRQTIKKVQNYNK